MHKVFVYGTLKRGFQNYESGLADAHCAGRFRTAEKFPLVIGGKWFSPNLIDEPGNGYRVYGEVFDVTADCLAVLDRIESVHRPNGYKRIRIAVEPDAGGSAIDVWAYLKDRANIDGIHTEPMAEYVFDPRYIVQDDPRRTGGKS